MSNALIIFLKNPVKGKVKTRLAAAIGEQAALDIYLQLVKHTLSVASEADADCFVFFSDTEDEAMLPDTVKFKAAVQHGENLGERMLNASATIFNKGYKKNIIIGTDCPDINSELLEEAFLRLDETDVVFGPATDGGYYLLGMKKLVTDLFFHVPWSTDMVLKQSVSICKSLYKSYDLLKELSDIDNEEDLIHFYKLLKKKVA